MHPVVVVGWLRPYYASDALAAAPDFQEDSADYTDFSENEVPETNLEKIFTRQGAWYLVQWKQTPYHNSTWKMEMNLFSNFLLSWKHV
jgi:hypothetical protein